MINAVSAGSAGATPAASAPSPNANAMGRDEFLQLLVTQLRHQDPMSPMKAEDFAAQLAQFSSVEQLIGMREDLGIAQQTNAEIRHLLNTTLAADTIGRTVLLPGSDLEVNGPEASLDMDVPEGGAVVRVSIRNADGVPMGEVDAGLLEEGRVEVDLSSLGLEPGSYTIEVTATTPSGEPAEVIAYSRKEISGVQFGPQGVLLVPVTGEPIPMGDVIEIL